MLHSRLAAIVLSLLLSPLCLRAQCGQDHRSNKNGGILVTDFNISGTKNVSATELADMTGDFVGSCFNEDSEEMGERVRAVFQDRGYFAIEVKHVTVKPGDPLGIPKPVTMEIDVSEGPRYRLANITFVDSHAFSSERLRQAFPLKSGDVFERGKVASGLESLRQLYSKDGYLDFVSVPDTEPASNATMSLKISVTEGPQYHMGNLEIAAAKEAAGRLRMEWKLQPGAVYDSSYLDKYIEANRDLLPTTFTRDSAQMAYDCPHAVIDLKLVIDPVEDKSPPPKGVPCESAKDKPR